MYDNAERYGIYGDKPGVLSPGVKERSLSLNELDSDDYGYVLAPVLAREQDKLTVQTSRVICVPPSTGDPLMEASGARVVQSRNRAGADAGGASSVPLRADDLGR